MSNGKVKDLSAADSTVQQDITRFDVGLLLDRYALVAAVLHDEVMILARARGVPIDGNGGFHGAVAEPAVSKGRRQSFDRPESAILLGGMPLESLSLLRFAAQCHVGAQSAPRAPASSHSSGCRVQALEQYARASDGALRVSACL
jgi:hypothetical protein